MGSVTGRMGSASAEWARIAHRPSGLASKKIDCVIVFSPIWQFFLERLPLGQGFGLRLGLRLGLCLGLCLGLGMDLGLGLRLDLGLGLSLGG